MGYLSSLGFDVVGTEIKDDYKSNLKSSKHITHNTLNDFPFEDNSFDFIYSRLSLHYFNESDLNGIFDEIKRMVKIDGYFAFSCKLNDGGYSSNKKFYSLEKWTEITEDSGFTIISSEKKSGKLYGKSAEWVEIYAELRAPKITISSQRI